MAQNEVTCRYCKESFVSRRGKPGYVDECPNCLYEKTAPPSQKNIGNKGERAIKRLERELRAQGVKEEVISRSTQMVRDIWQ
jgi:hypothetical protein